MATLAVGSANADVPPTKISRYLARKQALTAELKEMNGAINAEWARRQASPDEAAGADKYVIDAGFELRDHEFARLDILRRELISILGESAPPGFAPKARLNIQGLLPRISLPAIDGLLYETAAQDASVVVSPVGLLERELEDFRWAPGAHGLTLEALLDKPDLYLGTLFEQSPARFAARLPVTAPNSAAYASALLLARSDKPDDERQDLVVVAVIYPDRVYFASKLLQARVPMSPACAKQYKRQAKLSYSAARSAFRACSIKALSGRPELLRAAKETQVLVESLHAPNAGP